MEILPAIIPQDIQDLEEKLSQVRGLVSAVQIDILDGKYTPAPSWPYNEDQDEELKSICSGDKSLPFSEDFFFEADLMIENPDEKIEDFICAGFGRIIVHLESANNISTIVEKAKMFDVEIGVAIGMETDIEELEECIEKIDFVQFMAIDNIGFQGEEFNTDVLEKISTLREQYPDITISVDGGVNLKNAVLLISAGANRLAAGSTIFNSDDVEKTISQFQNLE
ncbi:hypothetical protein ACFL0K_02210 [Patescibacteria group bacterium]